MGKGVFVTFEGGEGAGKTTLIRRLEKELQQAQHVTLQTREPGGTPLGEKIRQVLLKKEENVSIGAWAELFLFLAARAQHVEEVIKPGLSQGKIVLCDRFSDSSVAYQGIARGLGQNSVQTLCAAASAGLEPDVTFYLDLDPTLGMQRAHKAKRVMDRMESEEQGFHEMVRQGFLKLARENSQRIMVIDASLSAEKVLRNVLNILHKHV